MKEKNMGIEWLRILSMYMVVVLHTLGQGGILSSFQKGTMEYSLTWFLETASFGAVDCFALISGYVGWNSHFSYRKFFRLWLQVAFYTIGITALFSVFMPEAVTQDQWFGACFPIIKKQYWYMTAYAGMFVLIPVLNQAAAQMKAKQLSCVCLAIFAVFSLLPNLFKVSIFGLGGGYSTIWLCLLYLLGAFWCKYKSVCLGHLPAFFSRHLIVLPAAVYLICTVLSLILKLVGFSQFVGYTSPTILIGSGALLVLFSQLSPGRISTKAARFLAPSALSVYLIHVHPLVWDNLMLLFAIGHFPSGPLLSVWVLAVALGIYLACSLIDLPRRGLFRLLFSPKMPQLHFTARKRMRT